MKKFFIILLCCLPVFLLAQNDCESAIIMCGDSYYSELSDYGPGIQELDTSVACDGEEHNSLWLRIDITTSGTFGFKIIPNNLITEENYDFWLFGPAESCENKGNAVRCSTSAEPYFDTNNINMTGMMQSETDTSEGPGQGNSFVAPLEVTAGETYYLLVDRPFNGDNFNIIFSLPYLINPGIDLESAGTIPLMIEECDDDGLDDLSTSFDLTGFHDLIVGGQDNLVLDFYETADDAFLNVNPITDISDYTNTANPQHLYWRISDTASGCFAYVKFAIAVSNDITAGQAEDIALCDINGDGFREFDLSQNDNLIIGGQQDVAVAYYASEADAQGEVNSLPFMYQNQDPYMPQTIWAHVKSTEGCFGHAITSFGINIISEPENAYEIDVNDFSSYNNSITVNMPDAENHEFSIDGVHFGENPIFAGLEAGFHTVYIRARNGCYTLEEEVLLLDYPRFFSPNGDGKSDTWHIPYLTQQGNATVTVYDRYGKIVGGFKGGHPGWDGTFEGVKLPATDYWFVLELNNGRIVKGHFSMVR